MNDMKCPKCSKTITIPSKWNYVFLMCHKCSELLVNETKKVMKKNGERDGPNEPIVIRKQREYNPLSLNTIKHTKPNGEKDMFAFSLNIDPEKLKEADAKNKVKGKKKTRKPKKEKIVKENKED